MTDDLVPGLQINRLTLVGRARIEAAVASERERCIAVCESWVGTFQDLEITRTSAREYAVDAIEDIISVIRKGIDPRALAPEQDR